MTRRSAAESLDPLPFLLSGSLSTGQGQWSPEITRNHHRPAVWALFTLSGGGFQWQSYDPAFWASLAQTVRQAKAAGSILQCKPPPQKRSFILASFCGKGLCHKTELGAQALLAQSVHKAQTLWLSLAAKPLEAYTTSLEARLHSTSWMGWTRTLAPQDWASRLGFSHSLS